MAGSLSAEAVRGYRERGYHAPVDAFSAAEVAGWRSRLEALEAEHGGRLAGIYQFKPHLHQLWADEIVHRPEILDAVESLIGPDILLLHFTVWVKDPGSPAFVSWHQDGTYFGLHPHEHVTAWVALSDSTRDSGCVEVVPGSHTAGQMAHETREASGNMLRTGQHIPVDESAVEIALLELRAGQLSLHHTHLLHNSRPNRGADRRIGLGISYIPTRVACSSKTRLTAMLVRGEDRHGHFDPEPRPRPGAPIEALLAHSDAMRRWNESRAEQTARVGGLRERAG